MSYFGFKSQIFLNNFEWGIKYFKLKGRKKSLEGRTLAMYGINHERKYQDNNISRPFD